MQQLYNEIFLQFLAEHPVLASEDISATVRTSNGMLFRVAKPTFELITERAAEAQVSISAFMITALNHALLKKPPS